MKRIAFFIFIYSFCLPLFSQNENKQEIAQYIVTYNVKLENKHSNLPSKFRDIISRVTLESSTNTYDFVINRSSYSQNNSETYYIKPSSLSYSISNLGTETHGESYGSYEGVPYVTYNINKLVLKPGEYTLGYAQIYGYINGMYQRYFQATYSLMVQPSIVECQYVNESEHNYNFILFNDPVCIKATTGFPKEVYKWRYSYSTSKGVTKSGTFEPYDSADNGATIYVMASDFMSEADFNDLVESQKAIHISPDGATGYYKPLSVKGINVTARPTAPTIKSIEYQKPLCYGESVDYLSIKFNRSLLNGEKIRILVQNQLNETLQYRDSVVGKGQDLLTLNKSFLAGNWQLEISGTYRDKSNKEHPSYSEGVNHSKTITITAPEAVNLSLTQIQHSLCYSDSTGSIEYNVIGGTGSKTCYLVDSASGTVLQEHIDVEGLGVFDKMPAGNYQIYATDQNGCFSDTATQTITSPDSLSLQVHTTDATIHGKNNGILKATYSGGVAPYQLSYGNQTLSDESAATQLLLCDSLEACQDTLYLTDANGCFVSELFSIAQPDKLLAYVTQDGQVQCFGDATASLTIDSITGGIAPYHVLWESDGYFLSNMNQLGSLSEGSYNLTVTDAAGAVYTQEIQITSPSILHLTAQATPASCLGNISGSITLQAEGGSAPYAYFLNDSMSATGKFTQLSNGTYVVSVEDKNGCLTDTLVQVPVMDGEMQTPQANFLVAGQVPLHDDVHLINIMDKAAYDSIVWVYPQENVSLYEQDEQTAQLIFLQEGEYLLGMHAYKGYCSSTLYKKVKAIEQASTLEAIDAYLIENFSIDQSPNSGNFTTYIELNRVTDVHLCVYNATTGLVVKRQQLTGSKCYEQSFEFYVPTGEYILFITIPEWQQSRYIKFVIY